MTTFRIKVQTEALVTAYIEVEAATDGLIEDAPITATL
jgi:hypothetical protein